MPDEAERRAAHIKANSASYRQLDTMRCDDCATGREPRTLAAVYVDRGGGGWLWMTGGRSHARYPARAVSIPAPPQIVKCPRCAGSWLLVCEPDGIAQYRICPPTYGVVSDG